MFLKLFCFQLSSIIGIDSATNTFHKVSTISTIHLHFTTHISANATMDGNRLCKEKTNITKLNNQSVI